VCVYAGGRIHSRQRIQPAHITHKTHTRLLLQVEREISWPARTKIRRKVRRWGGMSVCWAGKMPEGTAYHIIPFSLSLISFLSFSLLSYSTHFIYTCKSIPPP
jgi:hypothetical protein